MALFVFGIIVTVALYFLLGFRTEKYSENGRVKLRPVWKSNRRQLFSLCGLILIGLSCMSSVPTGHTGIVTTFGKVENYTYEAGVHAKLPWQEVVRMDNRNQKGTLEMSCFSSDIQEVDVIYSINYQIEKSNAQTIYRSIGVSYYDTVMVPRIQEAVKSVIAQYTADELVERRDELSRKILDILVEDLAKYNIEVVSTAVENLDFTDAFTAAVEAKQVAAQNKLQAEIAQQQATMEESAAAERKVIAAEAAAETDVIEANAEAEIRKIAADAAEYAGEKDAEINKMLADSLTEALLRYYLIQNWDGKLPETFVGEGGALSILDLAALVQSAQQEAAE